MTLSKNYTYFSDRKGRAAFIAKHFQKYIAQSNTVLDVGCDDNILKKIIGQKVTGIDLYGTPDYTVDLEQDRLSRFANDQFDMVICTEVLEHLENFYPMVDELLRVSRHYVLISLPNCFDLMTKYNIVAHNKAGKFYGLPLTPPHDRHRWIFSWKDLDVFFKNYAQQNKLTITECFLHFNFRNNFKGLLGRFFTRFFDIRSASQSYWIVLSKQQNDSL